MPLKFLVFGILGIIVGIAGAFFSYHQEFWRRTLDPYQGGIEYRAEPGGPVTLVNLLDPEMAPPRDKPLVTEGFRIMMDTKKYCHECGNILNCNNCHFCGGATLGGKNGGISLVGVTKVYPRKLPNGSAITLEERIQGCFMRSLNGRPLPKDSPQMIAMLAYLEWIAQGVESVPEDSWLGLKPLRSEHKPDPENGAKIFAQECAKCHGAHGEGQQRPYDLNYPPLWGDQSFNLAAGMNKLPMISSFIYYNMPYQDPHLTVEQALDVAAFVISQHRPMFKPPAGHKVAPAPATK